MEILNGKVKISVCKDEAGHKKVVLLTEENDKESAEALKQLVSIIKFTDNKNAFFTVAESLMVEVIIRAAETESKKDTASQPCPPPLSSI